MQPIEKSFSLLQNPKRIFIATHYNPDGDALGSILGLQHYLKSKGHEVTAVTPNDVPAYLEWMPGANALINYEKNTAVAEKALAECDIIFVVDLNDPSRTRNLENSLTQATQPKILIDHHLFPNPIWDYGISLPEKSSTCEMVFDFIAINGDKHLITQKIATCLYTGIMTDTGSFRFPCTSAHVHSVVAELLATGMQHADIQSHIYDSWGENRMRFLGYTLIEKMVVLPQIFSAYIAISKKDINLFAVQHGDTEGIVNYPLSIHKIKFAALITERNEEEVKFSFRSKGNFDVNFIAKTYFNGGGHFNAAGGTLNTNFEEAIAYFNKILSDIHPQ